MISCKNLIAWSCLSPIENGDNSEIVLTASARLSIAQRAASEEKRAGTGQSCGEISIFCHILIASFGDTHRIALVVLQGRSKVPDIYYMLRKGA